MTVVVSIGGSVLSPDLSPNSIIDHAEMVRELVNEGIDVGVVVGGGPIARDYIETARALGEDEITLDTIGIDVTRLNAKLLIAALDDIAAAAPSHTYRAAGDCLRRGEVCVMGGVAPAQTTDAVSAALAEYVNAELLVYATSVSGVYDADPNEGCRAAKYDRLTAQELVGVIADIEMTAGSSAPVDLLAAKIIQRSGMRTIVIDGHDPNLITKAVLTGEHEGTDIIPVGGRSDPDRWTANR